MHSVSWGQILFGEMSAVFEHHARMITDVMASILVVIVILYLLQCKQCHAYISVDTGPSLRCTLKVYRPAILVLWGCCLVKVLRRGRDVA